MFNVHSVHTVHRNDVTSNRVCGAAEVNILFRSRSNQKKGKTEENENSRKHWQGRNRQYDATSKPGKVCVLDSALCAKKMPGKLEIQQSQEIPKVPLRSNSIYQLAI